MKWKWLGVDIEVPDVRNKTLAETKKLLKEAGLEMKMVIAEGEEITGEEIVKDQLPKPGIKIKSRNKVEVYHK